MMDYARSLETTYLFISGTDCSLAYNIVTAQNDMTLMCDSTVLDHIPLAQLGANNSQFAQKACVIFVSKAKVMQCIRPNVTIYN